jgi:hypothetical protein
MSKEKIKGLVSRPLSVKVVSKIKRVSKKKSAVKSDVDLKGATKEGVAVFDQEAKQVENALQRSFGSSTVEYSRRSKASDGLFAVATHWTDGDAKRLVLALAKRYGTRIKISNGDLKKPLALPVDSSKNSVCNSAKLKDLDWQRGWWTDDSFGMHYLHVYHKDGETIHRVYCKHCQQPRIENRNGKLYWLFCK